MDSSDRFFTSPDLEAAIDREPLIISPDVSLLDAIALMSKTKDSSCALSDRDLQSDYALPLANRSDCALIMQHSELLGILTERDIVKLIAQNSCLENIMVAEVMTQPVITLLDSNFQDIFAALFLFRRYRIRHLPLVNQAKQLLGIISPETIRRAMRPANLLKLRRVADVVSRNIVHASQETKVIDIVRLMTAHQVSCIIITEVDSAENILVPVGIITERDIVQFKCLQLDLDELEAQQVMSSPLYLLSPDDSLLMANQEMQRRRVRRLVVSWNWGQGLGIVTQTSILRIFDPIEMYGVIETLQTTIEQLKQEKAELLALIKQKNGEK